MADQDHRVDGPIDVDYLAKLRLEDGDTLVLRLAVAPSDDRATALAHELTALFKPRSIEVLILDPGDDLAVIAAQTLEEPPCGS